MTAAHSKVVECSCGAVITGANDDTLVTAVQKHAKETHDMELSADQVMSMARPA